jgi:phage repressor protein C with HTH and peptisase S24 domain
METIGSRIRAAREAKGLTQDDLAQHFGIRRVSVTQWEGDTTKPGPGRYRGLSELLGGEADWYQYGDGKSPLDGKVSARPSYPKYPPNASPIVPVNFPNETIGMFGRGVGGEDGRFVLNGQRVMDVLCPPTLIGVKDAYGVFVHGGSMRPRYREGEGVFVNPHMPVKQDDYAVIQTKGDYDGDEVGGFIKQFISMNAKELVLAQHQKPETFPEEATSEGRYLLRFPRSKVVAVHKIVWAGEV